MLDPYVPAYKVGSGEIDWIEALERMAGKGKPFFWPPAPPRSVKCSAPCTPSWRSTRSWC